MGTTIPKSFSQITKITNLITFLFQGVYSQSKTSPISAFVCVCASLSSLVYITYKFCIKLEFIHILHDIYIALSIFISEQHWTSYGKFSEIL